MSMRKIYSCDICREELKNPSDSFGLHFNSIKIFTLGGYNCTEGVHICFDCARQLAVHLDNAEIKKQLGI